MKTLHEVSLKDYSTFKTDEKVRDMIFLEKDSDFVSDELRKATIRDFYILGEGSNTLFASRLLGTAIVIRNKGIKVIDEDDKKITVKVNAGVNWNKFVEWSIEKNLIGLQNLVDIPGTVGAAPIQNIVAYGVEVKEYIKELTVIDIPFFTERKMVNEECRFGYRDSIFKRKLKNKVIIKNVTFELEKYKGSVDEKYLSYNGVQEKLKGKEITLNTLKDAIKELRAEKLPPLKQYGSCGNTFEDIEVMTDEYEELEKRFPGLPKYPTNLKGIYKIPSAYIFEKLGWKGKREGDVGTWVKHPLVVVNYGNATGLQIYKFIMDMQRDFRRATKINPNIEINIFIEHYVKLNSKGG